MDEKEKLRCLESFPRFEIDNILSPYMPQVRALSLALEHSTKTLSDLKVELDGLRRSSQERVELLQSELDLAHKVLRRRTVRYLLLIIDFFFFFKWCRKKRDR